MEEREIKKKKKNTKRELSESVEKRGKEEKIPGKQEFRRFRNANGKRGAEMTDELADVDG